MHAARLNDVFCEGGLGLAKISADSLRRTGGFVFDNHPDLARVIQETEQLGPATLDIENLNSAIENAPAYKEAMAFARGGELLRPVQKAHIACFFTHLLFRHPRTLNHLVSQAAAIGVDRWAVLASMKHIWSDANWLTRQAQVFATSKWIVHEAHDHTFPLSDLAVLCNDGRSRLWCPISPRRLIEICIDHHCIAPLCTFREVDPRRDQSLLRHYRRLCIESFDRQIIFHDRTMLDEWCDSVEFRTK